MNIYLIAQTENQGYDTYDSVVVVAENEEIARSIHPDGPAGWKRKMGTWVENPEDVRVYLIGKAASNQSRGIILSSFNAG